MKPIKTNVTRMLDAKKIGYKTLFLKDAENLSGTEIAKRVFSTRHEKRI